MREIVLSLSILAAGMLAQADDRPNVVFILSDDQSWGHYGFMGHPHLKTPNLDGWDKLIVRPTSKELYNLKNDPDDRRDISAQDPDKVQKMSALINDWLEATPILFPPTGDQKQ